MTQRAAAQLLEVGAVGMRPSESSNAMRYRLRYPSPSPAVVSRACPVCGGTPQSSRSIYCGKAACKQRAYRLRHQSQATVDRAVIRKQLQRLARLVAHTSTSVRVAASGILASAAAPNATSLRVRSAWEAVVRTAKR